MALHVRKISFLCPRSPVIALVCSTLVAVGASAHAQVATSITGNNVTPASSTQIVPPAPGGNIYGIEGGHTAGMNLFHSFGEFNVGAGDVAQFQTGAGPNTLISNILGRVTGQQSPSQIFGAIDSATYYPSANLFMMNPYGFLFGPTATVNVGGMVAFTSADYFRLQGAEGEIFYADPTQPSVLTTSPVAAFGFLGSNPGAIMIQGSQFTVAEGTGISLVGGSITVQSDTPDGGTAQSTQLSAPNGKIQLASAATPGEFDVATLEPLPNVHNTSFISFGTASLMPGANINVTGKQTVSIRGGQFVLSMNDAVLSTADSAVPQETISLSPGSSMISSNAGVEAGADVELIASHVQLDGTSIQSLTTGEGAGGTISITATPDGGPSVSTAGTLQIKGGQIQTASLGPGTVGNIQINTGSLSMTDGAFIDSLLVPNPLMPGQPGGGTIAITATESIFVTGQRFGTTTFLPSVPEFPTFTNIPLGIYSENLSDNTGSRIVIETPSLTLQPGLIGSHAFGAGAAGDLSLHLGQLTLKDGGLIESVAFGTGATGSVQITASDSVTMSGFLPGTFQIGPDEARNSSSKIASATLGLGQAGPVSISTSTLIMNSNAFISSGSIGPGGAGDVNIQAARITLTKGASINSSVLGSGPGGTVSVTASEQLSISGHSVQSFSVGPSLTAVNNPSTISAVTFETGMAGAITINTPRLTMFDGGVITTATGGDGPAGSITVNAGSMNLSSGASISSSSGFNLGVGGFLSGDGAGGTVTVNATGPVTITDQGSGLFTTTVGNGAGGNINLRGSAIQISDGASISATSSGSGNAGNITVTAGNQLRMMNSSITTEASQSSGGNIKIVTNSNGTVQLTDSMISASVLDGTGGGGSVNIDPQYVLLQNSQILANAVFGSGGNILMTTNLLLPDTNSMISASSQFGQQGTVTIQSPNAPGSGQIIPLGKTPLILTALLSQRCAAVTEGIFSSFTVAGRDSVPANPGSWLSSPLALAPVSGGSGQDMQGKIQGANGDEYPHLSLRRIAPPGFLTQSFAVESSEGCTS